MKQTGDPAVLTVKGQAEVVVQSAAAYQSLLQDKEIPDNLRSVSRGLEQAKRGEGQPMREFLETLGAEFGIADHREERACHTRNTASWASAS